ncbi:MAG: pentapeptide repeat-containing protein [Methylocystis sp.]|uniref:pentapeptide repeat-containing protein n=1 Tax=Methylocystis sp. TaxID=1911079 RepID=UPI003D14D02F
MTDEPPRALAPANENAWYLMATLYGEQRGSGDAEIFDRELARRNRCAWNRWCATFLSRERQESLRDAIARYAKNLEFDESELIPYDEEELRAFIAAFERRAGDRKVLPPNRDHTIYSVHLDDVQFERHVRFDGFLFPSLLSFANSSFSAVASFQRAIFLDYANFSAAAFSGASFNAAVFLDDANFAKTRFSAEAKFFDSVFRRAADFKAAKLMAHADFSFATFETRVPDFRDASLPEEARWRRIGWPEPPADSNAAIEQIDAYARLKAEMERLKKHEEEQALFSKELRARRELRKRPIGEIARRLGAHRAVVALNWIFNGAIDWFANWAYEFFSGYGLSIGRPLASLGVLLLAGTLVFATTDSLDDGPMDPLDALELSATNLISFLPYKPDGVVSAHLSTSAKWLGNAQALLGLVLLFLLGLALRNRFRMK